MRDSLDTSPEARFAQREHEQMKREARANRSSGESRRGDLRDVAVAVAFLKQVAEQVSKRKRVAQSKPVRRRNSHRRTGFNQAPVTLSESEIVQIDEAWTARLATLPPLFETACYKLLRTRRFRNPVRRAIRDRLVDWLKGPNVLLPFNSEWKILFSKDYWKRNAFRWRAYLRNPQPTPYPRHESREIELDCTPPEVIASHFFSGEAPTLDREAQTHELCLLVRSDDSRVVKDASSKLLALHYGLLNYAVRTWGRPNHEDDLFQEAFMGLLIAAKRFDASRGVKFASYAYFWLRSSISRALKRNNLVRTWRKTQVRRQIVNLSTEVEVDGETLLFEELVPDDTYTPEDPLLGSRRLWFEVSASLNARTLSILQARAHESTLAQIGDSLNVSRERIRQILYQARRQLECLAPEQTPAKSFDVWLERVAQAARQRRDERDRVTRLAEERKRNQPTPKQRRQRRLAAQDQKQQRAEIHTERAKVLAEIQREFRAEQLRRRKGKPRRKLAAQAKEEP